MKPTACHMPAPAPRSEAEIYPLREYRITWRGDSHVIAARSRAAARYASWKAFREAGYRADLPTFAGMIRIAAARSAAAATAAAE